jgi:hypothetical protein
MGIQANRRAAVKGQPVVDPAAWTAAELAGSEDWIIRIDAENASDLRRMASEYRSRFGDDPNSLLTRTRQDFDLGSFAEKVEHVASELKSGKGLALVRGLPIQDMDLVDMAIVYWAIGLQIGTPNSNNPDGDMIGLVTDLGKDQNHPKQRGYQTRETLDYHNDQANVVGLLCVTTARRGGESKIVSSLSVYNELIRRRPDLLDTLTEDYCWSLMGEVDEGDAPYYTSPIFSFVDNVLSTSFGPVHIRKGHALEEAPDMTSQQAEAITVMEGICEELHYPMIFEPGDMQFLNNMVTLHTRNEFEDWPDPERKRLLWRLWLNVPNIRPVTPYMKHWQTGLLLKNTAPRIDILRRPAAVS